MFRKKRKLPNRHFHVAHPIKTMYLTGIKDILIATKPPEESQYLPGRYSDAEITKSIDHFLREPRECPYPCRVRPPGLCHEIQWSFARTDRRGGDEHAKGDC